MSSAKKHVTAAEMREADRRAIEEIGIPGAVLMYNAGRAVFSEILGGPVGVVCGKGNNGGDGYVVALLARAAGVEVRVVALTTFEAIRGDARTFHDAYRKLGGEVIYATEEDDVFTAMQSLGGSAVLVDAMLGTGFVGDVRGPVRSAIVHWPRIHTIAVDIPSGLNADTGDVHGPAITADLCVTFQAPKVGFQNPAARKYLGELIVADIGIPARCFS